MPAAWRLLDGAADPVEGYRSIPRKDVLSMVEREPRLALDLGCGTGATGELLKQRFPAARVYGVEPNAASARRAEAVLDKVLHGRLEDVDLAAAGVAPGSVDLVIAADVLEHMVDPWKALRTLRPFLSPEGALVASLPNLRNLPLLCELADRGRFRYDTHGVLDVTHLRFFTRAEMDAMFRDSGYRIRQRSFIIARDMAQLFEEHRHKETVSVRRGRVQLSGLSADEFRELCSIQILLAASPRPPGSAA
jgi:SAM-dependent methyltransferase